MLRAVYDLVLFFKLPPAVILSMTWDEFSNVLAVMELNRREAEERRGNKSGQISTYR